jgi:hypothetical protein
MRTSARFTLRLGLFLLALVVLTGRASAAKAPTIRASLTGSATVSIYCALDSTTGFPSALILFQASGANSTQFVPVDTVSTVNGFLHTFTRSGLPAGIYTFYVVAFYTGTALQSNNYSVTIKATGPMVNFTSQAPPYRDYATVGTTYSYDADATSSDGGAVTYSIVSANGYTSNDSNQTTTLTNVSINATTGLLQFTPGSVGIAIIRIRATLNSDPTVQAEQNITLEVHSCARYSTNVTGRVTDASGNGVGPGTIAVVRIDSASGRILKKEYTVFDANGYYWYGIDDGFYQLQAYGKDFISEWYQDAYIQRDARILHAGCGDTLVANFTVAAQSSQYVLVSGTVTSQSTGQQQSARVTFIGFENGVPDSVRWERRMTVGPIYTRYDSNASGNTGAYQTSLPDNYTWIGYAEAFANGTINTLAPQYYNGVGNPAAATNISLANGPVTVNFALLSQASYSNTVSGTVTDYNGSGLGARVVAFPMSNFGIADQSARSVSADTSNGTFTFTNLVPGDYVIWAIPNSYLYAPGYLKTSDFAAITWHNATHLTVTSTSSLSGNTIKVRRSNGADGIASLRGSVRGTPGSTLKHDVDIQGVPPVAGALVMALNDKDEVIAHALSNEKGEFTLDGLGTQPHTIVVDKIGFAEYRESHTISQSGMNELEPIDLQPTKSSSVPSEPSATVAALEAFPNPATSTISVRFVATKGSARVSIVNTAGFELRSRTVSTVSGANSLMLDLHDLPAGIYMISIADGSSTRSVPVTVVR